MSIIAKPFDPSKATSNTFDPQLSRARGAVVILNTSIIDLKITPPDNNAYTVPANSMRCKHYDGGYASGGWTWAHVPGVNIPPATVTVESYTEGVEAIPAEFIVPLTNATGAGLLVAADGTLSLLPQPRAVTVPIVTASNWATELQFTVNLQVLQPFPNIIATGPAPSFLWDGLTFVNVYLYMLACSLGDVTGPGRFALQVQEQNAGHAVTATHDLHRFEFTNGVCYSPSLSTPARLSLIPANTTAFLAVSVEVLAAPAFPCRLQFNAAIDCDVKSGNNWPGSIGGGLAGSVTGNNVGGVPLF